MAAVSVDVTYILISKMQSVSVMVSPHENYHMTFIIQGPAEIPDDFAKQL